jgi:hypothetical protein
VALLAGLLCWRHSPGLAPTQCDKCVTSVTNRQQQQQQQQQVMRQQGRQQ